MSLLALGLDLGSSGLRLALLASEPDGAERLLLEESSNYPRPFEQPQGWIDGLIALAARLDPELRQRVSAIAVAGTSGTLLCCRPDGSLLPGEAGLALPYHRSCPEQAQRAATIAGDPESPASGASGSLARALQLIALAGAEGLPVPQAQQHPSDDPAPLTTQAQRTAALEVERPAAAQATAVGASPVAPATPGELAPTPSSDLARQGQQRAAFPTATAAGGASRPAPTTTPGFWLRHQADWLMGWLLGDWRWGEEGNNLRLGWDLEREAWSGAIASQPWSAALPQIRPCGSVIGRLSAAAAARLGLNPGCLVVAGSTDANAGVLAADPAEGDGLTVLGTTLVLKQFVSAPIRAPGVNCHRVDGRWLLGGASNAGAGILRRFFTDDQIRELSRQIDPRRPSGLDLLPLPARGERFPVEDPTLEPRLEPRPVSDALYLQALLEGLTALEKRGWQRLQELGAPPLRRVLTLGGGARNPQWRSLRQRALGVPVLQRPESSAALGMARLALRSGARMASDAAVSP